MALFDRDLSPCQRKNHYVRLFASGVLETAPHGLPLDADPAYGSYLHDVFRRIQRKNDSFEMAGGSAKFETVEILNDRAALHAAVISSSAYKPEEVADAFDFAATVQRVKTKTSVTLIRFFGQGAKMKGSWLLCCPQPTVDADGIALPESNDASFLAHVVIPAGTEIFFGVVQHNFGKLGGATQFYIPGRIQIPDSQYSIFEKVSEDNGGAAGDEVVVSFGEEMKQPDKLVRFRPVRGSR